MKSWKTVIIVSAVFVLFSLIISFPACAQQKCNLKFNHVLGVVVVLVIFWPDLALWLPNLTFGKD
jgi:hypothetical protein